MKLFSEKGQPYPGKRQDACIPHGNRLSASGVPCGAAALKYRHAASYGLEIGFSAP